MTERRLTRCWYVDAFDANLQQVSAFYTANTYEDGNADIQRPGLYFIIRKFGLFILRDM